MTRLDMTEHLQPILLQSGERLVAVDKDRSITYRDLDRLSDDLALRLLAAGALPGERVVLAIDRSVYALLGIVAAMKAGLAYVPPEWDGVDEHAFDRIHGSNQSLFLTRSAFSAALGRQGRRVIVIDSPDASTAVGWSAGGLIAYEMAQQMAEAAQPPALLSLIDSKPLRRDVIGEEEERFEFDQFLRFVSWIDAASPATHAEQIAEASAPAAHWLARVHETLSPSANATLSRENLFYVHDVFRSLRLAYAAYEAPAYAGEVELFVPTPHESASVDYWRARTGSVVVTATTGDHYSMLSPPHVQAIASVINDRLRRIIAARQDRP